jgi:hypothetical protein
MPAMKKKTLHSPDQPVERLFRRDCAWYQAATVFFARSVAALRAASGESIVNAHCKHCRMRLSGPLASSTSPEHLGHAFK